MAIVVGVSALYHDAACCLVRDGRVVAAAQEERFSRIKFDPAIPVNAFRFCLNAAGLTPPQIDCVAYYELPWRKLERVSAGVTPGGRDLARLLESWNDKTDTRRRLAAALGYEGPIRFYAHHLSHCASAFYASPFEEAAILSADGVGEHSTTTLARGSRSGVRMLDEIRFPHSLGLFYAAITAFLGFQVNSDEYKVMGLAPYGTPRFREPMEALLHADDDGRFRLQMHYFDYERRMYSEELPRLLGIPARAPGAPLDPVHADVAASAQARLEEILLRLARSLRERTRMPNLCLAGGVALNCVANRRLLAESGFRDIFVQPAAGDAGGCLGAAMLAARALGDLPGEQSALGHVFLGPSYPNAAVQTYLDRLGVRSHCLPEPELLDRTVDALVAGRIVGWFQGAMEFGPRALGARSILADPRRPDMKDLLNRSIKQREGFRPFAPVCPADRAGELFEVDRDVPFMTFTVGVKPGAGLPAVTHVDGSARLQTVREETAPRLFRLLRRFGERTGTPVLLNTSFNMSHEPIVCSPFDAFGCFRESGIDLLVIEDLLVDRREQDPDRIAPGTMPLMSYAREIEPYLRDTYFFS